MAIYLTSDLHIGHSQSNIIEYCGRPFPHVPAMNEALVDNWNETIGPSDLVFVLGDVCMGKIDESLEVLTRLNGKKRLVPGNHDRCWEGNGPKHVKWIDRYADVGFPVTQERKLLIGDFFFRLDHFPYEGDHTYEDRYVEHRPTDDGSWLLCGHVHDEWYIKDRQINVGVDVWDYKPVHIDAIIELRKAYGG